MSSMAEGLLSSIEGDGPGKVFARTAIAATAGGISAELGGGKFANGALSAAFVHLFNAEAAHGGKPNLRETQQEQMLRENGNVYGYYMARAARADAYAETALRVVMNDWPLGKAANFGLAGTAIINGITYDEYDVNVMLMQAHGKAVNRDKRGIPRILHHEQITQYHHRIFNSMGLPATTFGGTPFTGTLGESRIWAPLWCGGCDTQ